jgi:hypothetical protein
MASSRWQNLGTYIKNISNPVMLPSFIRTQRPSLLFRVDGRSPDELSDSGGLPARVTDEELAEVRKDRVEKYQGSNQFPFAYGACIRLASIFKFLKHNTDTDNAWIYTFTSQASPLNPIKLDAGIETHGMDAEKEHLIFHAVPLSNFYAAVAPKDRVDFIAGKPVPNAFHEKNPNVPAMVKKSDLESPDSFLKWLKSNKCDKVFSIACNFLLGGVTNYYKQLKNPSLSSATEEVTTPVEDVPPKPQTDAPLTPGMGIAAQIVTGKLTLAQIRDSIELMRHASNPQTDTEHNNLNQK